MDLGQRKDSTGMKVKGGIGERRHLPLKGEQGFCGHKCFLFFF